MSKNIFNKLSKKVFVGIVPIIFVGVFLCAKPVVKNIFVESSKYKTPANTAFTDMVFYKCVIDEYNNTVISENKVSYDTNLTDEQLATISSISCNGYLNDKIEDTSGIEKLTNLKYLHLRSHDITEINLQSNTLLETIDLTGNKLTNINLSNNSNLVTLNLTSNDIVELDTSSNSELKSLTLSNCKELSSIDLSNNSKLEYVEIGSSKISNIDLTRSIDLRTLVLQSSEMDSINLSSNVNLNMLNLRLPNLSQIDLSNNPNLTDIRVTYSKIESINLTNNTSVKDLSLVGNQLTEIDLSNNSLIEELYLGGNSISTINLSNLQSLSKFAMEQNQLTNIDLSNNSNLTELTLSNNSLTSINLSNNSNLKTMNLSKNSIENIDLSSLTSLMVMKINNNKLKNINLANNTSLSTLEMANNALTSIDLSPNIINLDLSNNILENINLNGNTQLKYLILNQNKLINTNFLSNLPDLETLNIGKNSNISLDLTNNVNLKSLTAGDCNLKSIDLSNNGNLETLSIGGNEISTINLSNNPNLKYLSVTGNHLKYIDLSNNTLLSTIYASNQTSEREYLYVGDEYETNDSNLLALASENSEIEVSNNKIVFKNPKVYTLSSEDKFYYDLPGGNREYFKYSYDFAVIRVHPLGLTDYTIDASNSTIFTGNTTDNDIIIANTGISGDIVSNFDRYIENDKYIVKHNDNIIKEFDIVNYSSTKYDMSKRYLVAENPVIIYVDYVSGKIKCTNCRVDYDSENNIIQIKYGDDVLKQFDYVGYSSDKYDMSGDSINVNDAHILTFLNNINCINCYAEIYDSNNNKQFDLFDVDYTLKIKRVGGNELIKEFSLNYLVMGVELDAENIELNLTNNKTYQLSAIITPEYATNKNVTWSSDNTAVATVDENGLVTAVGIGTANITVTTEGGGLTDTCSVEVSEITTYNVIFKDGNIVIKTVAYEEGANVSLTLESDNPTKEGYILSGWKLNGQQYGLISTYIMPNHDVVFVATWQLKKPTMNNKYEVENGILKDGIELNTNVNSINLDLSDIYEYTILDNKDNVKTQGNIGTGDRIKIKLKSDNTEVVTYTVSIKGDINGDGEISVSDVSMIYKYLKRKTEFSDAQSLASNVNGDEGVSVSDISMIYKHIKRKINLGVSN